jgi:hypothetical protein
MIDGEEAPDGRFNADKSTSDGQSTIMEVGRVDQIARRGARGHAGYGSGGVSI